MNYNRDRFQFLSFYVILQERLLIAVMAIASCEFMFEETRNYVMQRKAFGKTIADLQVKFDSLFCTYLKTSEQTFLTQYS